MAAVGIIGASGFTGAELLRLCAAHPDLDVVVATGDSQAGTAVADLYPSLAAHYGDLTFAEVDDTTADGCDVVFLGLPHGASQALVPDLASRVGHVIDLAADFRLRDAALYPEWYDEPHTAPGLLVDFAYGLPELYRPSIVGAPLIAVPGCYPTATSLALAPFVWGGHVEPSALVVDAASGVSGAGRPPKPHTTFCAVDEDYSAYGLVGHRHTPEMEQAVGTRADGSVVDHVSILFTP
ncbi:MAG TPA: N-acetyl-gamma-glutamyl-phosphate reductase, partial [Acidimicrobiaceae bacterium]|nr:N-acetyl-gamma-glutamyl-phosphate reductase [Acidimicrobiaceae bacterium]